MSLHGYPDAYGSGNAVAYAQPSSSSYPYQNSHASLFDPNTFRQFYASHLATLTFNSRPIIQNLSMIAQEYTRMSNVVVQCVEAHIRRVPANIKLPAWYLLDAMSKNVPIPYAGLFAPLVAELFLDSYYQVDPPTKSKMEEMLLTWRDGGQNNREVFGVVPQVAIERAIWQGGPAGRVTVPRHAVARSNSTQVTKAQVLADLEVILAQKERDLQVNPYDSTVSQHIEILQQLRLVVQTSHVKQQELSAIDKQLQSMSNASNIPAIPEASIQQYSSPPPTSQPAYVPPPPQPIYSVQSVQHQFSNAVGYPIQGAFTSHPQSSPSQTPISAHNATIQTQPPLLSATAPSTNITDLFNSLVKAGIVSATGHTQGNVPSDNATTNEVFKSSDIRREAAREYESSIIRLGIKLTSSEITKNRSGIVPFLYERMLIRCKQCAIRFPDDQDGKKQMDNHLDMHFRQNRKYVENTGRGHSRSWFVGTEDWQHDSSRDSKGKGRAGSASAKAAAAVAAEREAKLRQSYVVVPTGDEAKSIQCPICKETQKSEFLEEDEDWVWMNAVSYQGRVYHATCHAETSTADSLASRLRHEAAAAERSRSGTPEVTGVRATPPRTSATGSLLKTEVKRSPSPDTRQRGIKRKAENTDIVKTEGDETPTKKVTLSARS